jgi:DNA-binding NtrC family response regulator
MAGMNKNESETAAPGVPLSIIALDDDEDFRLFISGALAADGHDVRAVATPADLYHACELQIPDVVLLDMKMGRHSGDEVLTELRRRWPRLCIIVLTGYPSMENMRLTFKQDVFDYLAKPFSHAELQRVLAQATQSLALGQTPQDRLRRELGHQIRIARTEKGWTLKELSEASEVSVSQLSSIERGAHMPSVESLLSISSALGVKPSSWLSAAGL